MVMGRFTTSLRAGWNAALNTWSGGDALVTQDSLGNQVWDDYNYRLERYRIYQSYYSNNQYDQLSWVAAKMKLNRRYYKFMRSIFNPVSRVVEVYTDFVYMGNLNYDNPELGAIPLDLKDPSMGIAIPQIWQWSNWQENKDVFVNTGSKLGDNLIKVVDDRDRQRVRMEVLPPDRVSKLIMSPDGSIDYILIEYERPEDPYNPNSRWCVYGEEWLHPTNEALVRTYKDGKAWGWIKDANGNYVDEWRNEYGFNPFSKAKHQSEGNFTWGAPPFYSQIRKIDEVNDVASPTTDSVRRMVDAPFLITGASPPDEDRKINGSSNKRDENKFLYAAAGGDAKALMMPLPIGEINTLVERMYQELADDLPELSLLTIGLNASQESGVAIKRALTAAMVKISNARGRYDGATVQAQRQAMAIAGFNGYEGFRQYDLDDYHGNKLNHQIKDREVIPELISKAFRVLQMKEAGINPKFWLGDLEVDDVTIKQIEDEKDEQARQEVATWLQSNMNIEDDEDEDAEQEQINAGASPSANGGSAEQPVITGG